MDLMLVKSPGGALIPGDAQAQQFIAGLGVGKGLRGEFRRVRNPLFHRKVFALFNLAFDMWEAPALEYQGLPVAKNFDRFRKDLTVLAGHYTATTNLRGEVRLEAKSLSFANMDDTEFAEVYRGILGVVWKHVAAAHGYKSPAELERVVEELLRFES